jgi:hypothetical protein
MTEFNGFTPRESPELPDDPNSGSLSIAGGGSFGYLSVSGIASIGKDLTVVGISTIGLSSVTTSPTNNATMSFELLNNNEITIRVKCLDGVTRVGIVTLV